MLVRSMSNGKSNTDLALEKLEELRVGAWGYDHTFESSFHRDVFYEIEDVMALLRQEKSGG